MTKFRLIALLIAIITIPSIVLAQKGEKTFGVKTGYITRNESALAGIYFQYSFDDHLRLSPEAQVAFRHNDRDALSLDLNCHFPFSFTTAGKAQLYPLAGISYSSWNHHLPKVDELLDKDVSTRKSNFGLNLGAGIDLKCSQTLKLMFEARYTLVKSNSNAQISLGIGYIF